MKKILTVVQAFDRKPIIDLAMDDELTLEAKLKLSTTTFNDRSRWLQPYERSEILKKTAQLLFKEKDKFAEMIAREGGKPITDAIVEVTRSIDGLNNAAEELRQFSGQEIPMGLTPLTTGRLAFTTKEPIGVVAAISAFNHPLNLIVHQVAPAIAVGCPIIIKPAPVTPLSCLELVKLFRRSGLKEEWCQTLITDDNQLAEKLATDGRISFLSFIGSAKVGWYLRSKLAPGTHCALEHGGAAPVIVDKSADLNTAIPSLIKGGYYHAGQVCVSVQRIFVHTNIIKPFLENYSLEVSKLKIGDPCLQETEVGPLILPRETLRVSTWIDEAVVMGAKLYGGGRYSETTLNPAILLNPSLESKVSQFEIFGPVTCVYEYHHMDEAIAQANSLAFAFQASVFSQDIQVALKLTEQLQASSVMINDHTAFRADWMPFAGYKQSGYGIGGIPWTMREISKEKLIIFKK
jgi:acyl-CoA reductase-like NAD-dependent aldehyde dehydrogenase